MLAARLNDYDPHWLDSLCLSGRALWARLTPAKSLTAAPVRTTPIALVTRRNWPLWRSLATYRVRVALELKLPVRRRASPRRCGDGVRRGIGRDVVHGL